MGFPRNQTRDIAFRLNNPTGIHAGTTTATLTLPNGLEYFSHTFDPSFLGLWSYNASTRQLRFDGALGPNAQVGGKVRVRTSAALGTQLPVTLQVTSDGLGNTTATTTLVVNDQVLPSGAYADDTGGYGVYFGNVVATQEITNGVRVTLRPQWIVSSFSLIPPSSGDRRIRYWTEIISTSGNTLVPSGSGAALALANKRLLSPGISPQYTIEFTNLGQRAYISSTFSAKACAWTIVDQLCELVAAKTGAPLPTVSDMLSIPDYVLDGGALGRARSRFSPMPQGAWALSRAATDAAADIVLMTDAERGVLVGAIKQLFPTLSLAQVSNVINVANQLALLQGMLHRFSDLVSVAVITRTNPATTVIVPTRTP